MSEDAGRFPAYLKEWIRALMFWGLAALGMLMSVSLVLWKLELPSRFLAYGSALISFLSAAAASWKTAAVYKRRLLSVVALAGLLLAILFGAGFLLSKGGLSHDVVLSVSTFTMAGFLAGSMILPQRNHRLNLQKIHKRKARHRKLT